MTSHEVHLPHPILVVTTSINHTEEMAEKAEHIAHELNAEFVCRERHTLPKIFDEHLADRVLVLESDKLTLYANDGTVYNYHPNMAFVRALNILRGTGDTFIDAANLRPGDHVLDCTAGFAGEAMLASMMIGAEGEVVALESVPELALITREGLQKFHFTQKKLGEAARRVALVTADYRDYLRRAPNGSFDVVCFDPFFGGPTAGSENTVNPLARFGNTAPLHFPSITEARRVARRSVVIKFPYEDGLPPEILQEADRIVFRKRAVVAYAVLPAFAQR